MIGLWKALRRWLEGAADAEFTAAGALRELGGGLALGFLLFSAMACVVMLLGGMRIEGVRGAGRIWALLAMAVTSGVFEALFRGVLFRHVEAMLGSWAALAFRRRCSARPIWAIRLSFVRASPSRWKRATSCWARPIC